jgi:homocitrate synthase NifV
MGRQEQQKIRQIVRALPQIRCTAWCRARYEDLLAAVDAEVSAVHLSVPVSAIQLAALGHDWNWVFSQLGQLIPWARKRFDYVSIGAQDASRCDTQDLIRLAKFLSKHRVDRLRLADTVGLWNPIQCYGLVAGVVAAVPTVPIGVHCHDDLGMATANTVVALLAGAHSVDVTVNGLGERAGNAALEEVAMALEVAALGSSGIDTSGLVALSKLVETCSRRKLPIGKAIVGDGAFRHESGIHVHAMLRDSRAYEPFAPERVGHSGREFVLGKHSGNAARHHMQVTSP